jgi:mannose-6-phosphate isomerase-like protein (cupin superfamily)
MTTHGVIGRRRGAGHYVWGTDCDGWHLVSRSDLSIIHERMPADRTEIRHRHAVARQFFFVVAGEPTIEVEGEVSTIRAGEGLEIEPGAHQRACNASRGDIEFPVISHPMTRGDRVDETS